MTVEETLKAIKERLAIENTPDSTVNNPLVYDVQSGTYTKQMSNGDTLHIKPEVLFPNKSDVADIINSLPPDLTDEARKKIMERYSAEIDESAFNTIMQQVYTGQATNAVVEDWRSDIRNRIQAIKEKLNNGLSNGGDVIIVDQAALLGSAISQSEQSASHAYAGKQGPGKSKAEELFGKPIGRPSTYPVDDILGTASHTSMPWDDPLKNTHPEIIAGYDVPRPGEPFDPSGAVKVYYNPRYPSKRRDELIKEAIKLLHKKKGIGITIKEMYSYFNKAANDDLTRLCIKAVSMNDKTFIKTETNLCVELSKRTFDRKAQNVDQEAQLLNKLDTNTFIMLRVAFLLLKAIKDKNYLNPLIIIREHSVRSWR